MSSYLMYQNFDDFNASFTPMGSNLIKRLCFQFENEVDGRWTAEYLKYFLDHAKQSRTYLEPRISIYCRRPTEWESLGAWAKRWDVGHEYLRLAVQVPRIYPTWRKIGAIKSFGEMLSNFFQPMFEATLDPEAHPNVAHVLRLVCMIDHVDDESKEDL